MQDEEYESTVAFEAGEARMHFSRAGRFHIPLALQHGGEEGRHSIDGLNWQIEVEDSPGEQVFHSPPFTAEFLEDLERRMR